MFHFIKIIIIIIVIKLLLSYIVIIRTKDIESTVMQLLVRLELLEVLDSITRTLGSKFELRITDSACQTPSILDPPLFEHSFNNILRPDGFIL